MTEVVEGTAEQRALEDAKRVLRLEAAAIATLADRVGPEFAQAVELVHRAKGAVVVSGVGKSGHVGRKLAATLTSTGTPAVFVHPVDGLHGDLGLVGPGSVMLLFSKSGGTPELEGLLEFAADREIPIVAFAGSASSTLTKRATVTLDCSVAEEACSMDLAPTSPTTAAMAMGDALAVALINRNGFGTDDFAQLHPGGSLGRRLNLRVADVMETVDLPTASPDAPVRNLIVLLAKRRGTVAVIDDAGSVVGVVTAGDLTRLMADSEEFLDTPAEKIMTTDPRLAAPKDRATATVRRMEEHGIMALPVVEAGTIVGIVHLHDLLRAGATA
ncbi:MAG: KpsF/GutQ family sugar-phosphate isomerase [Longimicrobiales bacterium]